MPELIQEYLGDGVYVSYDGFSIILDLRGQNDYTKITLEPEVMAALIGFKDRVNAQSKRQN